MSLSFFGALVHSDPEAAKKRILCALVDAEGDRREAARALKTTHRSIYRYIERLKLWEQIDKLAEEHGFPRLPGPPRSHTRIREALLEFRGDFDRTAAALEVDPMELRARIHELDLWDDLDAALKAAGLPKLARRRARPTAA